MSIRVIFFILLSAILPLTGCVFPDDVKSLDRHMVALARRTEKLERIIPELEQKNSELKRLNTNLERQQKAQNQYQKTQGAQIENRLGDLLNARHFEGWVCRPRNPATGKTFLAGLAIVTTEWGRPTWLRLRVDPNYLGQFEEALLSKSIERLRRQRRAIIRVSHPARDQLTNELLSEANFRLERSLSVMSLILPGNDK